MLWRVTNRTRDRLLGDKVRQARTFGDRLIGLMGRRDLRMGEGLHIVPCNSIHTFFMRIPIDVAFLDEGGQIVKLFQALPPWRATSIYFRAKSVLELPAGVFVGSGTQEGDHLLIEKISDTVPSTCASR